MHDCARSLESMCRIACALAAILLLGTCSSDDLPKYVELSGLRVVTLVASSPEAAPGGSVSITPWVSDVSGAGRDLTYTAEGCLDPGIAYGAEPTCTGSATLTSLGSGTISGTLTAANVYTAAVTAVNVTLPASAVIFAGRSTVDQFNGVYYLVVYTVRASDGSSVKSIKRIVVSSKGSGYNSNPSFSDILADGASLSALPGGDVILTASFTGGSQEAYSQMKSDGSTVTATESLTTTWFITDGKLKYFRTANTDGNTWTPPTLPLPDGRSKTLVLGVIRDSRGGMAVKAKAL